MFLMKASAKTNGLNAYVSGIGATKRIVVWDTTAGRVPDDEVLFIFGHESGHYVLHHIPKMIAGSAFGLFFVYWACAGLSAWLAGRFGSRWGLSGEAPLGTRAGFVVLLFAISVAGFVLEPVSNTFGRYFEHQADVYGQEAIHGIVPDPQKTAVAAFNALERHGWKTRTQVLSSSSGSITIPRCRRGRTLRCTTIRGPTEGTDSSSTSSSRAAMGWVAKSPKRHFCEKRAKSEKKCYSCVNRAKS
jgi:Zn-dependent protease with chaperone function